MKQHAVSSVKQSLPPDLKQSQVTGPGNTHNPKCFRNAPPLKAGEPV
jgi:hypothetical protein